MSFSLLRCFGLYVTAYTPNGKSFTKTGIFLVFFLEGCQERLSDTKNATLQMCRVASLLVVGVLDSVEGLTDVVKDVIYVFNTY